MPARAEKPAHLFFWVIGYLMCFVDGIWDGGYQDPHVGDKKNMDLPSSSCPMIWSFKRLSPIFGASEVRESLRSSHDCTHALSAAALIHFY